MDIRTRKYHLVVFLALSSIGFQFFSLFHPVGPGEGNFSQCDFNLFHFFITFWPTGLGQGRNCPIFRYKTPNISKTRFFWGVRHLLSNAQSDFDEKKVWFQKNYRFTQTALRSPKSPGFCLLSPRVGWKKLLRKLFFTLLLKCPVRNIADRMETP